MRSVFFKAEISNSCFACARALQSGEDRYKNVSYFENFIDSSCLMPLV